MRIFLLRAAMSVSLTTMLAGCTPLAGPATSPSPGKSPISTASPTVVSPSPEDEGEAAWWIYLSRPGAIDSGPISESGNVDSLTVSVFDKMGPPTERMVMMGDYFSIKEEVKGIRFRFVAKPSPNFLLATEPYESTLFTIPLDGGHPANLTPTKLRPIVMESVMVEKNHSVYVSEGESNSIVRFQVNESGQVKAAATYATNASLPGIAFDPNSQTLWVAEGNLTSFDLSKDPDMKKPKTPLKGSYEKVSFLPGPKLLILEVQVEGESLPEKAFEVFAVGPKGLSKQGGFKPEPNAYAYGFTNDGRWMIVGGSYADNKVRSYRLEGAKITLVDTLDIASGSDHLDVYDRLVLIDRRDNTVLLNLGQDGKLSLKETFAGIGALMVPATP